MRKLKLFFELSFIFVIPILIILCSISFNKIKEYDYDEDGNIVSEEEVKNVDLTNLNWVNTESINNTGIKFVYYTEQEFNQLDQSVYSNFRFIFNSSLEGAFLYVNDNFYADFFDFYSDSGDNFLSFYNSENMLFNIFQITYDNYNIITLYNYSVDYDITFEYISNFWIKEIITVTDKKNTNPIYSLLVFCENSLGINTNSDVTKIINYYNCLWLLMWLCWHLFYGFAELFVHIFDKKELDVNK